MGWQSIETAPRDELVPIALWNGEKVQFGARWEGGFADWFHDWIDPAPTHWMAAPEPPEVM